VTDGRRKILSLKPEAVETLCKKRTALEALERSGTAVLSDADLLKRVQDGSHDDISKQ